MYLEQRRLLDLPLLDYLGMQYQGLPMDPRDAPGLANKLGEDIVDVCFKLVDPHWAPQASDPDGQDLERWEHWEDLVAERWGWEAFHER